VSAFDRAWTRRPFVSPARWMPMRSVPDLWAETTVTFSRSMPVATRAGGFDRSSTIGTIYLVANCHVETDQSLAPAAQPGGEALVIANWWSIFLPIVIDDVPLDPENYPRKGDKVTFTDDLGKTISMDIRAVISPETIADHFEIMTETWE
jgi:hypothetical protein